MDHSWELGARSNGSTRSFCLRPPSLSQPHISSQRRLVHTLTKAFMIRFSLLRFAGWRSSAFPPSESFVKHRHLLSFTLPHCLPSIYVLLPLSPL